LALKDEEKPCSLCGKRKTVYFRPYSGERLCRLCFIHSLERKVRRTISKYAMFNPDDRIALALSGGKDSLSLLQILHRLEASFPESELYAVTVNEGIEGYREEAVEHAAEACRRLGVKHVVVSFKELFGCTLDEVVKASQSLEDAPAPCSYCGVLRRRALNLAAEKLEATKIATAHNLDDEVQTLILNLIHGDVYKLGRIDPEAPEAEGFIPRVKPFREIPEAEVAFYAYLTGVKFQSKPCPYAGYALRGEVRWFLNRLEARHPGIKFTLYHSFEKLKPLVRSGVKAEILRCRLCGEASSKDVCEVCSMLSQLGKLKEPGKTN